MELEDTRRKLREAMLVSGQQGALNERDKHENKCYQF